MKTMIHALPQPPAATSAVKGHGAFVRLLMAFACFSLVSFMAAPVVHAAAPNGAYRLTSVSGTLTVAGQTVVVTDDMIKDLLALQDGSVTIRNNRLQLNRPGTAAIINLLGNRLGVRLSTSVTGPTYVQLRKSGSDYVGSTAKPVVVKFKATVEGQTISGNLKMNFRVNVREKTMVVSVPVSGSSLGIPISGSMRVVGKRR